MIQRPDEPMDSLDPRVEEVFLAVIEADPKDRTQVFEAETSEDPDLRRVVHSLLARDGTDGFDAPAEIPLSKRLDPIEEEIGPYQLLSLLGEGGMGRVYLAEQSEPLRRQVALKVIKAGMDTRAVLRRFEAERQVLAMMEHPNIARVYDAGVSATGRPYFAMEVVKGEPITRSCDNRKLSINERVWLFLGVLAAVDHAHQKGIIHRDLKPSNIIVAEADGGFVPKVIDFGVAKALHAPILESTTQTQVGAVIGTPEYMSPEQADPSNLDIDTRSDVFSLGVVLYELLTGSTPLDLRSSTPRIEDLAREIRRGEPVAPSTRIRQGEGDTELVASQRAASTRTLCGQLRGDLDWIVLRAIDPDRERRYASVRELERDLERYLRHEPVEAGPPSVMYRFKKLCRRRRGVIATVAALAVLLVVVWVIQWVAHLETQKQRAIATAVNDFFNDDILNQANPDLEPNRDITLREVLDRAAEKIGERFADQPEVELALRTTMGRTYRSLGELEPALRHLDRAYRLAVEVHGREHATSVNVQLSLAVVLRKVGNMEAAKETLEDALDAALSVHGEYHDEVASILRHLSGYHRDASQFEEAARIMRRVAAIERRTEVPPEDLPKTMNEVGLNLLYVGKAEEAVAVFEDVYADAKELLETDHPHLLIYASNLALAYQRAGEMELAESLNLETLRARLRTMGGDHHLTLRTRYKLATVYLDTERPQLAGEQFEFLREKAEKSFGEGHFMLGVFAIGETRFLMQQRRYEDAERVCMEGYEILRGNFPADHHRVQELCLAAAELYRAWNKLDESEVWRVRSGMPLPPGED